MYFVVLLWSISTLVVPFVAPSYHLLIFARVILGLGEGLGTFLQISFEIQKKM